MINPQKQFPIPNKKWTNIYTMRALRVDNPEETGMKNCLEIKNNDKIKSASIDIPR